jgi:hypothetical protein
LRIKVKDIWKFYVLFLKFSHKFEIITRKKVFKNMIKDIINSNCSFNYFGCNSSNYFELVSNGSQLLTSTLGVGRSVKNSCNGALMGPRVNHRARNICCEILLGLPSSGDWRERVWEEKQKFPAI